MKEALRTATEYTKRLWYYEELAESYRTYETISDEEHHCVVCKKMSSKLMIWEFMFIILFFFSSEL